MAWIISCKHKFFGFYWKCYFLGWNIKQVFPQGLILGQFLFLLYMIGLSKLLDTGFYLHAGNTFFSYEIENIKKKKKKKNESYWNKGFSS